MERVLASGIAAASYFGLMAEAAADPTQSLGPWGNLTALGILGAVLIWIVTRILPDVHQKFVAQAETHGKAMAESQAVFATTLKQIAEASREDAAKIAAAFSIVLSYPLLQRLGFNPAHGAHNTPAALHNLELAYIIGPIVFVMLGGACVIGWRLDAKKHGEIRAELERRDAIYATEPVIDTLEGPAPVTGPAE
jgi:Na+/melibiose symporter-like transporter